jgi:hypothetical protein
MKDKLGRRVWCPYGFVGKCYVLPSEERGREIARFHRWFTPVATLSTVGVLAWLGSLYWFGAVIVVLMTLQVRYLRWQRDMAPCEPEARPGVAEVHQFSDAKTVRRRIAVSGAICISVLVCGVILFERGDWFGAGLALLFCGSWFMWFGWRWIVLRRITK